MKYLIILLVSMSLHADAYLIKKSTLNGVWVLEVCINGYVWIKDYEGSFTQADMITQSGEVKPQTCPKKKL